MSFYREAMNGELLKNKDTNQYDEIVEVAELVQSTKGRISQLRIYVITDGITDLTATLSPEEKENEGLVIEYNVWDLQRIYQQHNIRPGKEKVEIDFQVSYKTKLQCLKMAEENSLVDAYLAIIPGIILAKVYKQFQQVLLEKNVRTFLQFKGKVNKGIRKTLREEPDMFLSYNNGISTTAKEIDIKRIDGALYITRLVDWQIVNGGQTTASIAACMSDKDVDLTNVYVAMKISVIKDKEQYHNIIKSISTFANSQTAIKNSDFSANDPFLIDLEKFSRSEWVPNGTQRPIFKWYFERTRGQYLDQLAQLSGYNEKMFKIEYPKHHKITKTDVAKYEASWEQKPFETCKGVEKNYALFVNRIKKENPTITPLYYKQLIGKAILFKTIDDVVRTKKLGGYKINLNSYIMSAISFLSNQSLDLIYIWEKQKVQPEILAKIDFLIPIIWEHFTNYDSQTTKAVNISALTKKTDCWEKLKVKLGKLTRIDDGLLRNELAEEEVTLDETQQNFIEGLEKIDVNYWFKVANWIKENNLLTPMERKMIYNIGVLRSRNGKFSSLKQAQRAFSIIEKVKELGFTEV